MCQRLLLCYNLASNNFTNHTSVTTMTKHRAYYFQAETTWKLLTTCVCGCWIRCIGHSIQSSLPYLSLSVQLGFLLLANSIHPSVT